MIDCGQKCLLYEDETIPVTPGQLEKIMSIQQDILEMMSTTGDKNTQQILNRLCKMAEALVPNALASIMLLHDDGLLYVRSAPSLPPEGIEAFNRLRPGSGGGSCGNVIYTKEAQFVGCIATDSRWDNLRHVADKFGLGACWSTPIYGIDRQIIGTFALTSFEERMPSAFHRMILDTGSHIVGISLQRERQELLLEQKRDEQLLMQQSRMLAMRELLGAVAHQWRQPLNALAVLVQDIREAYKYGEMDELYISENIENSMKQINFMSKTIDDFRTHFKNDDEKVRFTILDAVTQAVGYSGMYGGEDEIKIIVSCEDKARDAYVLGLLNEFKQVILAILSNAKDAVSKTKTDKPITINISNPTNGKVSIEITDNGGGIDNATMGRVFEPYFTTKDQGDGVGLGLYVCKTIIEDKMGGRLEIQSISSSTKVLITLDTVE